jgi:hypothetical protein
MAIVRERRGGQSTESDYRKKETEHHTNERARLGTIHDSSPQVYLPMGHWMSRDADLLQAPA